jgi:hypothetical protein
MSTETENTKQILSFSSRLIIHKQDRQCTYNVAFTRFRATMVAVESQ